MDLGTKISLEVLVGISSGVIGSIGAYIKLKSRIDRLEMENYAQEKEITDLQERKKEMNISLHKRIDSVHSDYAKLQNEFYKGHQNLETKMAQMELRIVKEIQNLAK